MMRAALGVFWLLSLSLLPAAGAEPALRLHASVFDGWTATGLDVENVDAVFAAVFARLPAEITVRPSENYAYWQLTADGREFRGNFRLPVGERDAGVLRFGYSEYEEFPGPDHAQRLRREKGCPVLKKVDDFTYDATHEGKTVRFRLTPIPQDPPRAFPLSEGEIFVMRTMDESGLPFFLLFNQPKKQFIWALNEENSLPERWRELDPGVLIGRRTGFVFRVDPARASRKILVAVRQLSLDRNDYYDGPFDQLADNHAASSRLLECLLLQDPALDGKIDACGNYTDERKPGRVAITACGAYTTEPEAVRLARSSLSQP